MGKHKWDLLNFEYAFADVTSPTEEIIQKTTAIFQQYFKNVVVK